MRERPLSNKNVPLGSSDKKRRQGFDKLEFVLRGEPFYLIKPDVHLHNIKLSTDPPHLCKETLIKQSASLIIPEEELSH